MALKPRNRGPKAAPVMSPARALAVIEAVQMQVQLANVALVNFERVALNGESGWPLRFFARAFVSESYILRDIAVNAVDHGYEIHPSILERFDAVVPTLTDVRDALQHHAERLFGRAYDRVLDQDGDEQYVVERIEGSLLTCTGKDAERRSISISAETFAAVDALGGRLANGINYSFVPPLIDPLTGRVQL